MRKVTQQIVRAFLNNQTLTVGNSSTKDSELFLHGNKIAWRCKESATLMVSFCGWPTPTTKERLNGLCDIAGINTKFHTVKGVLCANGVPVSDTLPLQLN